MSGTSAKAICIPLILAALFASSACSRCKARNADSNAKLTEPLLRLPFLASSSLDTLDPIQSVELVQFNLDNQIFEGLVTIDSRGQPAPALAESWEVSPDGKRWLFRLRDARFSDDPCFANGKGRVVTADDVLYSFKRGLDPRQGSKNSWALTRSVVGAADFSNGKTQEVEGLRKLDPRTVTVDLVAADRYFAAALTVPSTYVVPQEAVQHYGQGFGRHPVGTGPFRLMEWQQGQSLTLERNPLYGTGSGKQPDPPAIARVRFIFFRSEAQVSAAFDRGEVDARDLDGSDLARIGSKEPLGELRRIYPRANLVEPGWICKVHLFAPAMGADHVFGESSELRRALSQLFPRERVERDVLRGTGRSLETVIPPFLVPPELGAPAQGVPLPEETLTRGIKGRTVRIAYVSSRIDDYIVTTAKSILEKAGAKVILFPNTSINALFGSIGSVKPDLTLIYWSPYFPNVSEYITALLKSSQPVPNFTLFQDSRLDHLATSLRRPGQEPEAGTVKKISSVLAEQMPWIPIYYEVPLALVSPNLRGYSISPVSVLNLAAMSLDRKPAIGGREGE